MSGDSSQVLSPGGLAVAFAPVFAAAFGVQKLIEILDAVLDWLSARFWEPDGRPGGKRLLAGILSLGLGFASAGSLDFGVLASLKSGKASPYDGPIDLLMTALLIAGGTEAVNSLMKFIGYAKDSRRAAAENAKTPSAPLGLPAPARFEPSFGPPPKGLKKT
jgi:hypothetical protein